MEALGAHGAKRLVEDEAQKRRANPLTRAGDRDALEVEVQVRIAEAA
jgi:hypothetical protein